ncbi:hypothetical protein LKM19_28215 [Bacillus cereus]|nr:hypothetical protein [Bacillus cereus]
MGKNNLEEKAFIGYDGPLIGFIDGLIFWGIANYLRQEWMLAVLNLFLLINLVNFFYLSLWMDIGF